jgi:hypothetical protein
MRAPDEKFSGRYTETQWAAIAKAIHSGLGLDADRIDVPGDRLPAFNQVPEHALQDGSYLLFRPALEQTVVFGLAHYRPTSQLAQFRKLQRKTEDLRQLFMDCEQEHWSGALRDIPTMLSEISGLLADQIDRERPEGRRLNRLNTPRNHLMEELLQLWTIIGGKPTGKAIENFMRACLKPVFGPTSPKAIEHWLVRYRAGAINL